MGSTARKSMTVEEFYLWQQRQEDRYELVDGFPVKMMTGASNFHDVVVGNVLAALHPQLKGTQCWIATPDTATRTRIRSIRRPDVTVTGSPPRPDAYEAGDLKLLVEVLSPSNSGVAWERKLDEYRRLTGLSYLLLVDSQRVQATLYTHTGDQWEPTDADDLTGTFAIPEIGCTLRMADVYDRLSFEDQSS